MGGCAWAAVENLTLTEEDKKIDSGPHAYVVINDVILLVIVNEFCKYMRILGSGRRVMMLAVFLVAGIEKHWINVTLCLGKAMFQNDRQQLKYAL